ncbi:nuclear transport factor 2 family protein [Mucilaginibacter calamicampi]|uniref:Nuclear transport factor 2 family protein n=1 Tax=Mucilaginibacter calamicampi TaxID=1302352 RepID=A0ABW2YTW0_9SPHI
MNTDNKAILEKANRAVAAGDNEGFLLFCTDDTKWEFVGEQTLQGKDAVRQYMAKTYTEPPKFNISRVIADDDFVSVLGKISLKNEQGIMVNYSYCDVWRFSDGKMAELRAFVIAE